MKIDLPDNCPHYENGETEHVWCAQCVRDAVDHLNNKFAAMHKNAVEVIVGLHEQETKDLEKELDDREEKHNRTKELLTMLKEDYASLDALCDERNAENTRLNDITYSMGRDLAAKEDTIAQLEGMVDYYKNKAQDDY